MKEFIFAIAVCFGGVALICNSIGSYSCSNYEEITGKATKWVTLDSCYIKTEGGWQPWEEYEVRIIASEGLKGEYK